MLNSDGGSFGVYAGTAANSVNEMLSVSAQELKDVAETVNDEEIVRTKAQLRANLLMGRESVSASVMP